MAVNLMGFKKVSEIPRIVGRSVYDPLLAEVRRDGGIYSLDTNDRKRAISLNMQLRNLAKKRGYHDLKVGIRGTVVFVTKRK